jgi:hypothetical protein
MRARLLDVDVLAGLAGPDGLEGVGVVGGGDGDRVDIFVLEKLAEVGVEFGLLLAGFLVTGRPFVQNGFVDIAHRDDVDIVQVAIAADVIFTASAKAHAGDANGVAGSSFEAFTGDSCSSGRGCGSKEISSFHGFQYVGEMLIARVTGLLLFSHLPA